MESLTRIMHVEDDASIRAVTKVALETVGGLTLTSCAGGKEALAQYEIFSPQMILMDVMMPEMDGPSTLKTLQELYDLSSVPVLFMTAKVQPAEVERYHQLGVQDVIKKPFDPLTLAETLRRYWEEFHADQ